MLPLDQQDEMDQGKELSTEQKSSCDAQTQWSDPGMEDHTYSKGPTITCGIHSPTELPHPIADCILESDADSFVYRDSTQNFKHL